MLHTRQVALHGCTEGPLSSEYGTYQTVKDLGFQVKVLKIFQFVVPSLLGRGDQRRGYHTEEYDPFIKSQLASRN